MSIKIDLSKPEKVDIHTYKGDSGTFRITIDDVDLTEFDWAADIKATLEDDADVITSFDIVPVVGDTSSVDVVLSAVNSELLPKFAYYDIEMRLLDAVATIIQGSVTTKQDVSQP